MLPGEKLDKIMAVVWEYSDDNQRELTDGLALFYGMDDALEIVAELSRDTVLQWGESQGQSWITRVQPCVWCGWDAGAMLHTHEQHYANSNDDRPHHYDYRVSTLL